jgi:hypothetical protein
LSLPLVVAIAFASAIGLAAWQSADVVAELTDRAMHSETADAAAAVRQLTTMSRPPIDVLVKAAASGERDVADEAQHGISKLLRRLQRRIENKRGLRTASRQLAELAESLAAQQQEFSTADHPWLASTTRKIVRLANQIPPRHSPLVSVHCDAILGAIGPGDIATMDYTERR